MRSIAMKAFWSLILAAAVTLILSPWVWTAIALAADTMKTRGI
jgi:hypothetical protein